MIEKLTNKILQEQAFIEKLLTQSLETYASTQDASLNESLRTLMRQDLPQRASDFTVTLSQIADGMTFDDWQDFWLDMGIRIFANDDDWETYSTAYCLDDEDSLDDQTEEAYV